MLALVKVEFYQEGEKETQELKYGSPKAQVKSQLPIMLQRRKET